MNRFIFSYLLWMVPMTSIASVTVRDVRSESGSVVIDLDSSVPSEAVAIDYVRDIVQLTLNQATVYPAKMLHSDGDIIKKIFAYQYSPQQVRIRLSVGKDSNYFQDRVFVSSEGRSLRIRIENPLNERTQDSPSKNSQIVPDSLSDQEKKILNQVVTQENVVNDFQQDKSKSSLRLKGNPKPKIAGAEQRPLTKPLLSMVILLVGLVLVLIWVKRKKSTPETRLKSSILGSLFNKMGRNKSFIEVIDRQSLGPKQNIVVVKVRGQQLVLGVTQENIQLISQVDESGTVDEDFTQEIGQFFGAPVTVVSAHKNTPLIEPDRRGYAPMPQPQSSASTYSRAHVIDRPFAEVVQQQERKEQSQVRDQIRRRLEGLNSI